MPAAIEHVMTTGLTPGLPTQSSTGCSRSACIAVNRVGAGTGTERTSTYQFIVLGATPDANRFVDDDASGFGRTNLHNRLCGVHTDSCNLALRTSPSLSVRGHL